jgi:hypothetical protein
MNVFCADVAQPAACVGQRIGQDAEAQKTDTELPYLIFRLSKPRLKL